MKRKIGDFTLAEIKGICEKHVMCQHCPLRIEVSRGVNVVTYLCGPSDIMKYPNDMDTDMEVEIEEEKE